MYQQIVKPVQSMKVVLLLKSHDPTPLISVPIMQLKIQTTAQEIFI